jgi:hypothetical protein
VLPSLSNISTLMVGTAEICYAGPHKFGFRASSKFLLGFSPQDRVGGAL